MPRYLHESILGSESYNAMEPDERDFMMRLIVTVDNLGRYDARPRVILGHCYPLLLHLVTEDDIERMLQSLVRSGTIHLYEVGGKRYLEFTKWGEYQRLNSRTSKYPDPGTGKTRADQAREAINSRWHPNTDGDKRITDCTNRNTDSPEMKGKERESNTPPSPPTESAPAPPSAAPKLPPEVEEAINTAVRIVSEKPRWSRQAHDTRSDIRIPILALVSEGKKVTPSAIVLAATAFRDEAQKAQAHVLQSFIRQKVADENAAPASAPGPSTHQSGMPDYSNLPPARSRGAGLSKLRAEVPYAPER